jgi:hypothetical protein
MIRGQGGRADGTTQGEFEGDGEGSETEVVDADTDARVKNNKKGSRGPRWSIVKDLCLCDSWKAVSLDPITGAQHLWQTYWRRIYDQFNKRKTFEDYAKVVINGNENALSHGEQVSWLS